MFKTTFHTDIVFGDRYRDEHTGMEGIATGVFFYEHGCERVNLEVLHKDGKLESYGFDAPRLIHVESGRRPEVAKTGGPGLSTEQRGAPPRR
jgi:hypothetical protein